MHQDHIFGLSGQEPLILLASFEMDLGELASCAVMICENERTVIAADWRSVIHAGIAISR